MYKIVMSALLAGTTMSGCSGSAFAQGNVAQFAGNWKQVPDDHPNESYHWTIDGNGKVYLGGAVAGAATSINGSEITFSFTSGDYTGNVTFDRLTNYGSVFFTGAPFNSPKRNRPGPYGMKMTRE